MKKVTIGYIFNENIPKREDKLFKELAKEKNIDLVMINTNKLLTEKDIEYDVDKCDPFFQ